MKKLLLLLILLFCANIEAFASEVITSITQHDAFGHPIKNILENSQGKTLAIKEMQWDSHCNKISETNYLNLNESITVEWRYNNPQQLSEIIEGVGSAYSKHTLFYYNQDSLLSQVQKPDGIILTYDYSPIGQLIHLTSSDHTIDYSYSYDDANNLIQVYDNIQKSFLIRTYDKKNTLLQEQQSNGLTTQRAYDENGKCIELEICDGSSIFYSYADDHIEKIERNGYTHLYKRDKQGKLIESGFEKRIYSNHQLTHIITPFWQEKITYNDDQTDIASLSFQTAKDIKSSTFTYDAFQRLVSEHGDYPQQYTYDWIGNPLSHNTVKNTYNDLGQLIQHGELHYTYDVNGNLSSQQTADGELFYEYDALNRLITFRKENGEIYRYTYDALHRRQTKAYYNHDELIWIHKYLYDGLNEIGCTNENHQILEFRVLGDAGLTAEIGQAILIELGEKAYLPIHDHRGCVCCLIDQETQEICEEIFYSGYGIEQKDATKLSPWRFSSKRLDSESGLIYFGMRYYDPHVARWTTQDPVFNLQGSNTYRYASSNPISRIDPYGLFSFTSLWNSIKQTVSDVIGSINSFIQQHLSLEHNIKDKVEDVAVKLFGQTTLGSFGFYQHPEEVGVYGNGEISDKVRITLINGVLNDRHHLEETLEMVSEFHKGTNIHYIFRPTEGWTKDLIKSTMVKCGWTSPQAQQLATCWRELIEEMGGIGNGGKIIHYAHSIGAADTAMARELLTLEEQAMIQVYTLGSPLLLKEGGFQTVVNYVSKGDAICYFDPIGYIQSLITPSASVVFLKSSWWIPFIDHQLAFPAYKSILEQLGQQFQQVYGNS